MRTRYRLDIGYDGTAYAGWQIQPNGTAVQDVIQRALAELGAGETIVHGSGRTDQGVHARCQVAHVDLPSGREGEQWRQGLNTLLPSDIRVLRVRRVAANFHARKSAIGKEYRYFICCGAVMPPHRRLYAVHASRRLDVDRMQAAADRLVGQHDFAAFTANPNRVVASTVRRLDALTVRRRGCEIVITARGEGFLYRMVRSLAGGLMRVGEGALDPSEMTAILASRRRTARVPTAPPQGLFLWRVMY